MKLKEYFKQLKIDLKPMTFGQKVDHIWTYHKELILITTAVLILTIGLLSAFLTKPDVVFSGYMLNFNLSEDGNAYLTTGFRDTVGATGKKTVELHHGIYSSEGMTTGAESSYSTMIQITALCADQSLDYMLTNEDSLRSLAKSELYMDLETFFSPEEFAQWKDKILYTELDSGKTVAVGLDITDSEFVKINIKTKGKVYLSFIANTKSPDMCRDFLNYVLNFQ